MYCLAGSARPLAAGTRYGKRGEPCFDEGPEHIMPILMSSLAGVDPNDSAKTVMTLTLIGKWSELIFFVDCSSAVDCYDDLTEVGPLAGVAEKQRSIFSSSRG
jgi:proteasome activator subunit 4